MDPVTCTFEDVSVKLHKAVFGFNQRYGGDLDEQLCIAYETFLYVYRTNDRRKGSFLKRLSYKVWHELLSDLRKRATHKLTFVDPEYLTEFCKSPLFNLRDFLDSLTVDAQRLTQMAIDDAPMSLTGLRYSPDGKVTKSLAKGFIRKLRSKLEQEWSRQRFRSAFTEISLALREGNFYGSVTQRI